MLKTFVYLNPYEHGNYDNSKHEDKKDYFNKKDTFAIVDSFNILWLYIRLVNGVYIQDCTYSLAGKAAVVKIGSL